MALERSAGPSRGVPLTKWSSILVPISWKMAVHELRPVTGMNKPSAALGACLGRLEPATATEAVATLSDFQTFEVVGALVVVLDVDGCIVYWNRACSELTGYALAEVRGRKISKTGERRWIAWSHTLTRNLDGGIQCLVKTGIDRTERKEAEDARRANQAKLRELADENARLYADSLEANDHMVRAAEPQLVRGGPDRRAAARIIVTCERMKRLILQLLDLTRARLGEGFPLEPKPTDLREAQDGQS